MALTDATRLAFYPLALIVLNLLNANATGTVTAATSSVVVLRLLLLLKLVVHHCFGGIVTATTFWHIIWQCYICYHSNQCRRTDGTLI